MHPATTFMRHFRKDLAAQELAFGFLAIYVQKTCFIVVLCLSGMQFDALYTNALTIAPRQDKTAHSNIDNSGFFMKLIRRFTVIAACVCTTVAPASAGPDRVWITLGSAHISDKDFEQFNPGAILTWEGERFGYSLGAYRNSYGGFSVVATTGVPVIYEDDFEVSLFAGIASYAGYADRFRLSSGDLVPIAGGSVRYRNLFAQVFPGNGNSVKLTTSFGVTFELGGSDQN